MKKRAKSICMGLFICIFISYIGSLFARAGLNNSVISAEKFVLTDKNGKERAVFEAGDDDSVSLYFLDRMGRKRIKIGMEHEIFTGLEVLDVNNKKRVELGATAKSSGFVLYDKSSKIKLQSNLDDKDYPSISIYDDKNMIRGSFGYNNDLPGLALFDENEKNCGGLVVDKNGHGSLILNDGSTENGLIGYLSKDGSPGLKFIDGGKEKILLGSAHNGAAGIFMFDARSKEKIQLSIEKGEWGGLAINGNNDGDRVEMGAWPNSSMGLSIRANDVQRAELYIGNDDSTQFNLTNKSKKYKFNLTLPDIGKPDLRITEVDGKSIFEATK